MLAIIHESIFYLVAVLIQADKGFQKQHVIKLSTGLSLLRVRPKLTACLNHVPND